MRVTTAPVHLRQVPPPVLAPRMGRIGTDDLADDIASGGLFDIASNLQEALVSAGLITLGVAMIALGAVRVFGAGNIIGTAVDAAIPG